MNGEIEKANAMLVILMKRLDLLFTGGRTRSRAWLSDSKYLFSSYTYLPDVGIYAVWFTVKGGERYMGGMASIGYNVTFKDHSEISVEVNI